MNDFPIFPYISHPQGPALPSPPNSQTKPNYPLPFCPNIYQNMKKRAINGQEASTI